MARIHKVSFYVVDCNDTYNTVDDFLYSIDREFHDGLILHPKCKSSEYFEWDDDINLNHCGCTPYDCEKYFMM